MKDYSLNLTNDEWVQVLDGESDDSQLPKCCANVSELRDALMRVIRNGRNTPINAFDMSRLKQTLGWVCSGHDMDQYPVIKKICEQIEFDPTKENKHNELILEI